MGVSTIPLIEAVYLTEKQRLAPATLNRLVETLKNPDEALIAVPIDCDIVEHLRQILRDQVPDLPDRVIAGTALRFGVPVTGRDGEIKATGLQTIW